MICTLIFQAICDFEWDDKTIEIIMLTVNSSNQWVNYRIARSATRYGHNNIADMIFSDMTLQVRVELGLFGTTLNILVLGFIRAFIFLDNVFKRNK